MFNSIVKKKEFSVINKIFKVICFLGGANLDVLDSLESDIEKYPNEKNCFIAIGFSIFLVAVFSVVVLFFLTVSAINSTILNILISISYGFLVLISYWGIFSIKNRMPESSFLVKLFGFIAIISISLIATMGISKRFYPLPIVKTTIEAIYFILIFISIITLYILPICLKKNLNHSTYEREYDKLKENFVIKMTADRDAYNDKYPGYAAIFIDANIGMESMKKISELSKEYLKYMDEIRVATYDQLNNNLQLDAHKYKDVLILDSKKEEECSKNVKEQLTPTISKMKEIFNSVLSKNTVKESAE